MTQKVIFDYQIKKPIAGLRKKVAITNIKEMRAEEVFGQKAKNPQQMLYTVFGNIEGIERRLGVFTKPLAKEISPKSKLALFQHKYGKFPDIGMKIEIETNKDGYWNIVI
jgi:hypothetical protein